MTQVILVESKCARQCLRGLACVWCVGGELREEDRVSSLLGDGGEQKQERVSTFLEREASRFIFGPPVHNRGWMPEAEIGVI